MFEAAEPHPKRSTTELTMVEDDSLHFLYVVCVSILGPIMYYYLSPFYDLLCFHFGVGPSNGFVVILDLLPIIQWIFFFFC